VGVGGRVGRVFGELGLTVRAGVAVSCLVSLTLAPMLCSRFLKVQVEQHGAIYRFIERGFDTLVSGYRRTLDVALRHQAVTLTVFFATLACTIALAVQIPKGFFPIQDTGLIAGVSESAQHTPPADMMPPHPHL